MPREMDKGCMEERKIKAGTCYKAEKNVTAQFCIRLHILQYQCLYCWGSASLLRQPYELHRKVNSNFTVMNFLGTFMSLSVTQTQRGERQPE